MARGPDRAARTLGSPPLEVEEEADDVPKNLEKRVRKLLEKHPSLSWDQALARIAVDEER